MYCNHHLNLILQELLKCLRNCTKNADNNPISSDVLSLAILQAKIEINVTNSQLGIINLLVIIYVTFIFFVNIHLLLI